MTGPRLQHTSMLIPPGAQESVRAFESADLDGRGDVLVSERLVAGERGILDAQAREVIAAQPGVDAERGEVARGRRGERLERDDARLALLLWQGHGLIRQAGIGDGRSLGAVGGVARSLRFHRRNQAKWQRQFVSSSA